MLLHPLVDYEMEFTSLNCLLVDLMSLNDQITIHDATGAPFCVSILNSTAYLDKLCELNYLSYAEITTFLLRMHIVGIWSNEFINYL